MLVVTAMTTESTPPGAVLRRMLEDRGWTQDTLAAVTGHSRQTIHDVIAGKCGISPDMAVRLAAALGNDPTEWMRWDSVHQLSLVSTDAEEVRALSRLYSEAPIRDMQKRDWLPAASTAATLAEAVAQFFRDDEAFDVALRRSDATPALSPPERAWLYRARQLAASSVFVAEFNAKRLPAAQRKLRQLAAYAKEIERLSEMLAYYGIRFVVLEPLRGARIDGAAFWLGQSPTIAVSARWDRIDALWFTVMHEFMHIKNGDVGSLDVNLVCESENGLSIASSEDVAEQRANEEAAHALVPKAELDSFIGRTSPLYSSARIVQFAHRIKMHPGIIVGQLQHRGELRYSSHRALLVKVRKYLVETALTDGWGRSLSPGVTT